MEVGPPQSVEAAELDSCCWVGVEGSRQVDRLIHCNHQPVDLQKRVTNTKNGCLVVRCPLLSLQSHFMCKVSILNKKSSVAEKYLFAIKYMIALVLATL